MTDISKNNDISDIPEKFMEYKEKSISLSIDEMVVWLKLEEPEFAENLDQFMLLMADAKDGLYPYPKNWRIALENTGISFSLLYIKNTLQILQDTYNESENKNSIESHVSLLSKLRKFFSRE